MNNLPKIQADALREFHIILADREDIDDFISHHLSVAYQMGREEGTRPLNGTEFAEGFLSPKMYCPKCNQEYDDYDGFGFFYCEKCGYCTHASITGGKCGFCKKRIKLPTPKPKEEKA